ITTRLVVPRARYEEAVAIAAATMSSIRPGDPNDPGTVCGPLISARQRDRVQGYLDLAVAEGGRFACGGARPADREVGFYIANQDIEAIYGNPHFCTCWYALLDH
ncbi:aldehyde dehydrogenase family protein, partial [Leuconostoc mesenteroides]|nr:aldehyde dehydrogenase family protein [Leuconostoc mesenteroides]